MTAPPSGSPTGYPTPAFRAAAGLENAENLDLTDPDFVEWRDAGPEKWEPSV
ncbi:hypothetical protein Snoj_39220 [Streptomyces nojiriensis]|uniref:Uncharacterized protein n=1 Tax=Streptomyces nojiriensis TaxID=66374 RepID=A0ABQ3SPE2_9ACTN|nr:hypothetical protein GCM10010205_07870 [Streptomyces nojiriensis]GHI70004.1 hypothetical protein Snoj_39220 [Streptomyces nojiriensis]